VLTIGKPHKEMPSQNTTLLISLCSPYSRLQSQWFGSYWLRFRSKTSPSYLLYVMKYRPIFKL